MQVTVFEAQPDAGGQIRLTALNQRRKRDDRHHRMAHGAMCLARDVTFRFNIIC
jgi:hypothetical protein